MGDFGHPLPPWRNRLHVVFDTGSPVSRCADRLAPHCRNSMISPESSDLGLRLDEHHLPETNGRMSVCRKCGTRTESPLGLHHTPSEHQMSRSGSWLIAQSRLRDIELAKELRSR